MYKDDEFLSKKDLDSENESELEYENVEDDLESKQNGQKHGINVSMSNNK